MLQRLTEWDQEMPLSGGPADKIGNRYEAWWTVRQLIELLIERADCIQLEPVGVEGEGVEFWLQRGHLREYHQVKRQYASYGQWTIANLASNGVLGNASSKIRNTDAIFKFVSTLSVSGLAQLTERARDTDDPETFKKHFAKSKDLSEMRSRLSSIWDVSADDQELLRMLQRLHIVTIGEDELVSTVTASLRLLVAGESSTIASVLFNYVFSQVHQRITANDIWRHLNERGYQPANWSRDPLLTTKIRTLLDSYLRSIQYQRIPGYTFEHPQVDEIMDAFLLDDGPRIQWVTGKAGSGKSNVLAQVVERFDEQGWPIFALRADQFNMDKSDLPGNPANVLNGISGRKASLLVIDQLDAVSLTSGRRPENFDAVLEILHHASAYPRMKVLIACRDFDLDNDPRMISLAKESKDVKRVSVEDLSSDTVSEALRVNGLSSDRLNHRQIDLLRNPIHLHLYVTMASSDQANSRAFDSLTDLYDWFWRWKQQDIRTRHGRSIPWSAITEHVSAQMNSCQSLAIPEGSLDEFSADDISILESEHLLVRDNGKIAFFHETFFDYVFARRFSSANSDLVQWLTEHEQPLFVRAPVRQILTYQRAKNRKQYLSSLSALINSPDIRLHIKQMVMAYLANLPDPSAEEWKILKPYAVQPDDSFGWGIWRTWYQSFAWFQFLDSIGEVEGWLWNKDGHLVDLAVSFMARVQKHDPDRIATLLSPFVKHSDDWTRRILYVVRLGQIDASRKYFEFFLTLIDAGFLDAEGTFQKTGYGFWVILPYEPTNPGMCCEAIGHFLDRSLQRALQEEETNPFLDDKKQDREFKRLCELADQAPHQFATRILPFILDVAKLNSQPEQRSLIQDNVWGYGFNDIDDPWSLEESFLSAMIKALSTLAQKDKEVFLSLASTLAESQQEVAHVLLIHALVASPGEYADWAASYLSNQPEILCLGGWEVHYVVKGIADKCTYEQWNHLEEAILAIHSQYARTREGYQRAEHRQFLLLSGVANERLSSEGKRRLQELTRKFPDVAPPKKRKRMLTATAPPIPQSATVKMSNADWLRAMDKYGLDESRRTGSWDFVGGAYELAQQLREQAGSDPERFGNLCLNLPAGTHSGYLTACLDGVSKATEDVALLARLIEHCHELCPDDCSMTIIRAIESHAGQQLPSRSLEILGTYVLDQSPEEDPLPGDFESGEPNARDALVDAGINSVRGSVAWAVAEILFKDHTRAPMLLPGLTALVKDRTITVRTMAAYALVALLNFDRDVAVELFHKLCDTDDRLLGTRFIDHFLDWSIRTHYASLLPILERMLTSELPSVRRAGAIQACKAALTIEEAQSLAEQCLTSEDQFQRVAAARVAAANVTTARFQEECVQALIQLFNDPSDEVRSEASTCFSRMQGHDIGQFEQLAWAFVGSPSLQDGYDHIIRALETTTVAVPEITITVCERYLIDHGNDIGNIQMRAAVHATTIPTLAVKAHSQADSPELRSRCLDVVDELIRIGTHGIDKAIDSFDG